MRIKGKLSFVVDRDVRFELRNSNVFFIGENGGVFYVKMSGVFIPAYEQGEDYSLSFMGSPSYAYIDSLDFEIDQVIISPNCESVQEATDEFICSVMENRWENIEYFIQQIAAYQEVEYNFD